MITNKAQDLTSCGRRPMRIAAGFIRTVVLSLSIACGTGSTGAAPVTTISVEGLEHRFKEETQAFENAFDAFEKEAKIGQEFQYDLSPLAVFLRLVMRSNASDDVKQSAAVYLVSMRDYLVPLDPSDYAGIAEVTQPVSLAWKKGRRALEYEAEGLGSKDGEALIRAISQVNPDRTVRGQALIALTKLEIREQDPAAYKAVYQDLRAFSDVEELRFPIAVLDPENNVAFGKKVPHFMLPTIDGEQGQIFSNSSLSGKFYLLDFWATWCGPCLADRGALHRAYRRYAGSNFTIISVSMDKDPAVVSEFRKARWPMPWTNLFLAGGQEGATAKAFDVDWIGLPRSVLVDPQGNVVALQDDLGRDSIEATLARILGK
jgi:thiol-disulfide isomerase/thioredoxin